MTAFLGFGLVGAFLLIGRRAGYLRDIWRVDSTAREGVTLRSANDRQQFSDRSE
ncbi:hypothetical protein [Natrinema versiforme]|uniref:hypothetical protein n=1 Tax=Natrinema versiforme TaxID=88724 RepID=UPI001E616D66|nr:hypothetical protein [Natrinema versiforme]